MYISHLYRWLREAIKLAHISAGQEAAQHKHLYNCRAGVAELCCGDKVLVWLDAYQGVHRKLKNRWGSMLHMVVGQIADDIPAYVIENEKGKQKVLHHARLLLWSSAEEKEGLQMTATQIAFQVSMLVLEPLPIGEERSRVPYAWSINGFGLNLASFQSMLDAPEWEDRAICPCDACRNANERRSWPTEGEWQGGQLYGRWRCHSGGGCSTLNWNTPSRAQPYPSRKGEIETGWVICRSCHTAHLY